MSNPSKEIPALGNREIYPSDDILVSYIGVNMELWNKVLAHTEENYKAITGEWRYYNDGKQWLFKLQHRKKTVFWAGLKDKSMRVTFYFGDKAEPEIMKSRLPAGMKEGYLAAKPFGSLRPITVILDGSVDPEVVYELIRLKTALK
jgi:hypothetical protein